MNSSSLLFLLFCLILVSGCNTGPDFERNNINDPGAKNFKPNAPSTRHREITQEKEVILHWKDKTDFEDGYLVEKKTYSNDEFKAIDTLDQNIVTYTDKSRLLTPETSYRISSFVYSEADDTSHISKSSPKIIELDLQKPGPLDLTEKNNYTEIKWQNHLEYFDALMVGYKSLVDYSNKIFWVDTLSKSNYPIDYINNTQKILIETPLTGFTHNIILKASILNPENELQEFSTSAKDIKVNEPKFQNFTFTDEESLEIEWSGKVSETDFYEIYDSSSLYPAYDDGILVDKVPGDSNTYTLNRVFKDHHGVSLGIKAVKKRDESTLNNERVTFRIKNLENFNLNPRENNIQLQWEIPDDPFQPYTRFIIERSVNNNETFQVYEELSPDTEEFVDANILQDEIYYYRIKSASSDYSRTHGTGYFTGFTLYNQIQGNNEIRSLAISQDKKEIGVIEQSDPETLLLTDQSGIERQIHEPDHKFSSVQFSKDDRYIILTGDSIRVTYTKIYDRNTLEKKFQLERDNLNERILLLPNSNKLVTTEYYKPDGSLNSRRTALTITDINTNEIIVTKKDIQGYLLHLMFDREKNELITISQIGSKQLIVFNAENLDQIKKTSPSEISNGDGYHYDDESDILYILDDEHLIRYDIDTDVASKVFSISKNLNPGICCESISRFVHLKNPDLYAFLASTTNHIYVYDPSNDLTTLAIKHQGRDLIGLHYSSDNNQLILQNYSNGTLFYELDQKWMLIKVD